MAPLPKGAKVVYLDTPEAEPSREQRLIEAVRRKKAQAAEGLRGTGIGIPADTQNDLADLPGHARSALMGLTDNAGSRIESFIDTATNYPKTEEGEDMGWRFDRSDEIHGKYMADVAKHPGSNIVGAALQPNPLGKAKLAGRIVGAAGHGALSDYLGNTGPEAQRDGSAALSGVASAGVQGLAEGASPVLGKVARGLRNSAGKAAVNAAGMRGGIVNQPKRAGIHTLDEDGEDAIAALGNRMLDEDLIPFGGSKLAVQRRAEKMMGQAGGAAEAIRTRADLAGPFNQAEGVAAAAAQLGSRVDPALGGNLQTARASGPARSFITDAANTPNTFKAADDLKRGAYGSTNWSTQAPDATKLKRQTVSGYRQSIEDQVDRLLPGEGKNLHGINEKYGLAAQTADFAEEAAGRERANAKFGPMQFLMSATGAGAGAQIGTGAALAGAALPVAAHFTKTRGASVGAPLARLGSKGAAVAGGAVNQAPAAAGAAGNALEDYLRPQSDEERQKQAADWFTSGR